MKIGDFNPLDRKFLPKEPDPEFSVRKNKFVVENTIKKYEANRKKKMAEFEDKLGERTHAAASYLAGGGGAERSRSVDKYFGKTGLAHLRGEDIANQLKQQQDMLITDKKSKYIQKQYHKKLAQDVILGKGKKIKRTNAKKTEKRQKKV